MSRPRAVGLSLLALVACVFAFNTTWAIKHWDALRPFQTGDVAPGFVLASADTNSQIALEELRGQVVVLDFWATWCGPCKQTMPVFERLHKKYGDRGMTMVSINTDQGLAGPQKALSFARAFELTFTIYVDNGATSAAYDVETLPHMVIIDKRGVVRGLHTGVLSVNRLEQQLDETISKLLDE